MKKIRAYISVVAILLVARSLYAEKTLPDFTPVDERGFGALWSAGQLTADGKWLVYGWLPMGQDGKVMVVLRSTENETERRYSAGEPGPTVGKPLISSQRPWIVFLSAPQTQGGHTDALAVETTSGQVRHFSDVKRVSFVGADQSLLALEGYPTEPGRQANLTMVSLSSEEKPIVLEGAEKHLFDPSRRRVAWNFGNAVELYDIEHRQVRHIATNCDLPASDLTWSATGDALAFLVRNSGVGLVVASKLSEWFRSETSKGEILRFDAGALEGFPAEMELCTGKSFAWDMEILPSLAWRDDERGVFCQIRQKPAAKSSSVTIPHLALWHWQDLKLPSRKQNELQYPNFDKTLLGFIQLEARRFVQLGEKSVPYVTSHSRADFLLGYNLASGAYPFSNTLRNATQPRDYYLINIRDGSRRILEKGLQVSRTLPNVSFPPQLSPDGTHVLYQDNQGDCIVYDIGTGDRRNVTSKLPTRFFFKENDPSTGRVVRVPEVWGAQASLEAWSSDGRYALVSDYRDIWALPLNKMDSAVNLTTDGQAKGIAYHLASTDAVANASSSGQTVCKVEMAAPLAFECLELDTWRSRLAIRNPSSGVMDATRWQEASVRYLKAGQAAVWVMQRSTTAVPIEYAVIQAGLRTTQTLTDICPQRRAFRSFPDAKFLTFKTAHADSMHGVLYPPLGAVEGHRYPAIVWIYEQQNTTPFIGCSIPDFVPFLRDGYAVLVVDVRPRIDEPGLAAVEAVTSGIDAAVATGIIDREHLGLMGHSYGGFETYYIAVRTKLFKAAVPYAGMTDLISNYGSVNFGGVQESLISEHSQPYLSAPWWEHWDTYIENSPLFHIKELRTPLLIIHGNSDQAVPFSQALEMFNNLQRLGGKPVVLLEYEVSNAAGHELWGESRLDAFSRVHQFFDHFLKGAKAPTWWNSGVSIPMGEVPTS